MPEGQQLYQQETPTLQNWNWRACSEEHLRASEHLRLCISEIQTKNKAIYLMKVVLTENVHLCMLYVLLSCMVCFHVYTHVCFHLVSNVHIVRTFENRIPFQMFEKQHNVSYGYVSYIKSKKSFIWRKGSWFLKPFEERVEENHIYPVVKPNAIVKTGTVYRGCNMCYQFLENEKINFHSKI